MKADKVENQLSDKVGEYARQIWLAGLGAFARTQKEGGRFFDALVQEGQAVDARMKKAARGKTEQVKGRVEKIMKNRVEEVRDKAAGTWNKLEEVFQARVARALQRLGVPTHDDIQQLFQQVELLGQNIQELTKALETEARVKKIGVVRTVKAAVPTAVAKVTDPVL